MAIPGAYAAAGCRHTQGNYVFSLSHKNPTAEHYGLGDDLQLFCIAFRPENKIHLFPPSKPTAELLRDTVKEHWGVEAEHVAKNCYTLSLGGTPFLVYARREDALLIKYTCCLILEKFKAQGWELVVCTDLSSKTDLTTWYFAKTQMEAHEGVTPPRAKVTSSLVCVSLSAKRKLQLINATATLQKLLHDVATEHYEPGVDQVTFLLTTRSIIVAVSLLGRPLRERLPDQTERESMGYGKSRRDCGRMQADHRNISEIRSDRLSLIRPGQSEGTISYLL